MSVEEIKQLPISNISCDNSILFIWAVFPCLDDCIDVIKAWGYEYYGLAFDWLKLSKNGKPKFGCGYYTRQNNEVCLIGTKKNTKFKPLVRNVSCSILEEPREHSRKPDIIREHLVNIIGNVPRIELFARQYVDGWDCWGNEV